MLKLFKKKHGGSLSGYAILVGLVTGVSLLAILGAGEKVKQIFSSTQNAVNFSIPDEREPEFNLFVFGANDEGQGTVPEDIVFSGMTGGAGHSCAIVAEDDSVQCWGNNLYGQLNVPVGLKAKEIKAWGYHTCAITMTDNVVCWGGSNEYGENSPRVDMQVSDISVGATRGCGILSDGSVECWGTHPLIDQGVNQYLVPPSGITFKEIVMGDTFDCGITTSNELECWGIMDLGTGLSLASIVPPEGLSVTNISAGSHSFCVVASSEVNCWGTLYDRSNSGAYQMAEDNMPAGLTGVKLASSLESHCVMSASGSLTCWGYNRYGESTPPAENVDDIEGGGFHYLYINNE